ncbi:hypothetical protein HUJ04_003957 [Dendroctonus ponderosae]|nr:hypothetical protein HUJ04_003957 [Dendroctonus ponderosae]
MISIRVFVVMLSVILGLACAAPGYSSHKHVKIIVPSYHHTVHHHHIEKVHVPVHVPVPVVKKIFIPIETHHSHHDIHEEVHGGWWCFSSQLLEGKCKMSLLL